MLQLDSLWWTYNTEQDALEKSFLFNYLSDLLAKYYLAKQ